MLEPPPLFVVKKKKKVKIPLPPPVCRKTKKGASDLQINRDARDSHSKFETLLFPEPVC